MLPPVSAAVELGLDGALVIAATAVLLVLLVFELASFAALLGGAKPVNLEAAWRILLKNEFHDILPGSGIAETARDAEADLTKVVHLGETGQTQDGYAKALTQEQLQMQRDRRRCGIVRRGWLRYRELV